MARKFFSAAVVVAALAALAVPQQARADEIEEALEAYFGYLYVAPPNPGYTTVDIYLYNATTGQQMAPGFFSVQKLPSIYSITTDDNGKGRATFEIGDTVKITALEADRTPIASKTVTIAAGEGTVNIIFYP